MLQLGEFNLQLAFMRPGPRGKNIENQTRAIQNPALQQLFQIALLAGRQIVIEDCQFHTGFLDHGGNLLRLAAAHEQTRVRFDP